MTAVGSLESNAGTIASTVAELVARRADDDHTGLRFEDDEWTWREVVSESASRALALRDLGLDSPGHIGVLMENTPEFLFLILGAALAGIVVVGVNPTRRGSELGSDIRHADCRALFVGPEYTSIIEGLDLGMAEDRVFVMGSAEYAGLAAARAGTGPGDVDATPGPQDLYFLLFTSGSTGAPKAVRASQGRIAAAAQAMVRGSGFSKDDVLYCAMPMFHGNALTSCVLPAVASGATLVLRRKFSASGFGPDIRRYGVTYFNYVGRALAFILAVPPSPEDGTNHLKFAFGTEASPSDMISFKRRFGCPVVEGYGSSEGALSMTMSPGTPRNALGKPPEDLDVAVVDPETGEERELAVFDEHDRLVNSEEATGEMVVRGGTGGFEGYYANEEANRQRTRNGWYWTGDLGYRDADGFFYFAGRPADWLRVDGENFAAAPVERILSRYPGVLTAAVYPVPDATTGDQVMATLELDGSTPAVDFDDFSRFLADQPDLGTKWAPRYVRIGSVPLTTTSKVNKAPLRAQRWETDDPVWWKPPGSQTFQRLEGSDVEALRSEFAVNGRAAVLDT